MNDLIWNDYTESEHETILVNVQRLLKENYIVRSKDDVSKRVYLDITQNLIPYESILAWIGLSLINKPELGVVGYKNEIENDNENLKLVSEVGGFTFKANHDGETNIIIYYLNTDDTSDYKYKFVYKFKVEKEKIYWLEGEGYGVAGYPNPS